jgi:hypothetical protein
VTELLRRHDRSGVAGDDPPAPSTVLHAVLAGPVAALSGLAVLAAVVLITWVADASVGSSGGDAVRAAALAWLLGHGGGLSLAGGRIDAVPLGITVLAVVLLHRAGASVARAVEPADLRAAARATGALTGSYALTAAAVAKIAATDALSSSAFRAGVGAAVLAAAACGSGVLRAADLVGVLRDALPVPVPAVARSAAFAVAGLVGAGTLLVALSVAVHGDRFGQLFGALHPGVVGGIVLVLGCVLLVPNAALFATAYAAGPGFAIGAGTGISPFGVTLGPVPAFPLLSGLPQDDSPPPWVRAVLLLPVLAGVAAGVLLARRLPAAAEPTARRARHAAGWALVAGLAVAVVLAVLAALAGGSLGPGYLSAVGPSPWRVLLALAVEVAGPAALTAAVLPSPAAAAPPAELDVPQRDTPRKDSARSRSAGRVSAPSPAAAVPPADLDVPRRDTPRKDSARSRSAGRVSAPPPAGDRTPSAPDTGTADQASDLR